MKIISQRVLWAKLEIAAEVQASIGAGAVWLVGFGPEDTEASVIQSAGRVLRYRYFEDAQGRMNRSLVDDDKELLVVPNFTLYASTRQGLRPSFSGAAAPAQARGLFEELQQSLRQDYPRSAFGVFGADMQLSLCNDGPVTLTFEF